MAASFPEFLNLLFTSNIFHVSFLLSSKHWTLKSHDFVKFSGQELFPCCFEAGPLCSPC